MKTITAVAVLLFIASVAQAQSLTATQAKAHEGEKCHSLRGRCPRTHRK